MTGARVVLTDHPWEDLAIEREIFEAAGLELRAGPTEAPSARAVEDMVDAADPRAIMTCWAPVTAAAIARSTGLEIVARLGVGLDNIDVAAASARGAWVTNVPDYCVPEVSDHAIGLVLAMERGIAALDRDVRARGWHVPSFMPRRISSLVIGIIGYGRIGRETARKLLAFGCTVIASDRYVQAGDDDVRLVELPELQARADVIILHAPLTPETLHLVDAGFIAACAATPIIVNVSRGGLIDNDALAQGLDAGLLRGAALDVIEGEPAPPESLLRRSDVIVTPHVAYLSDASLRDLRRSACDDVVRVLSGLPPRHARNAPDRAGAVLPTVPTREDPSVPLDGGVSSDIRLVRTAEGEIVVKTALGRLKVAAEWKSDPARSRTEVDAIRAAAHLISQESVPEILWSKPEENSFAMDGVDPRLRNWKRDLLRGHVDLATARQAGVLLGRLHARSTAEPGLARRFADATYFHELRIVPFFENVATRLPTLASAIGSVVSDMQRRASALVHGDYSPKNILADGARVVVLDFEVTHWGDPRFDVGFCLSHLLLKANRKGAERAAIARAAAGFLQGYAAESGPAPDDQDLARLTGCLVLARLAGDSPIDYLGDLDTAAMRAIADAMILRPDPSTLPYFLAQDIP